MTVTIIGYARAFDMLGVFAEFETNLRYTGNFSM
jgi:hypothetical protein